VRSRGRAIVNGLGDTAPDAIGLVLAAGAATRFGSPKQVAPFRGQPMINWPIQALRAGGLTWVLAVLGAEHERVAARLDGAHAILAPDWQDGLSASLRAGVAAAARLGAARVVVALADQPLLSGAAVARVLAASRGGYPVVRADYGDVQGHPTALASATFAAVAELRGDAGARRLTGFDLIDVPCAGLGSPADADTPEDLERLSGS
jgi:CTP:molybdopterin cytidylyltransferase MocA